MSGKSCCGISRDEDCNCYEESLLEQIASREIDDLEIYRAAVAIFAGLEPATVKDAVMYARQLAKEVLKK
jgi:hypothetical protein